MFVTLYDPSLALTCRRIWWLRYRRRGWLTGIVLAATIVSPSLVLAPLRTRSRSRPYAIALNFVGPVRRALVGALRMKTEGRRYVPGLRGVKRVRHSSQQYPVPPRGFEAGNARPGWRASNRLIYEILARGCEASIITGAK